MHADTASRAVEPSRDRCHGDGRGVGGQDRVGSHHGFCRTEELSLCVQILDDRLDDEAGGTEFADAGDRTDACEDRGAVVLAQASPGDLRCERGCDAVKPARSGAGLGVVNQHLRAGGCRHLRDAGAHGAGAHDRDHIACRPHSGLT